jgi:molybdopterin/thiamine biosynthesis adenylyltransferase
MMRSRNRKWHLVPGPSGHSRHHGSVERQLPDLGSAKPVTLRASAGLWREVTAHILGGQREGHGGALLCGTATDHFGRLRLLGRDFVPAIDGMDYVPGTLGHHALTATFIRRILRGARDKQLVPLFIHSHGSGDRVGFSSTDIASHERGYPALLDLSGRPVGALVLTDGAVAGDVWLSGTERAELERVVIIGANIVQRTASPMIVDGHRIQDDRQARLFGDLGQQILRQAKIGVIGAGGAGMLAIEYLSRLGVGEIVVVEPERVELTNVPRLPGATRWDAMALLTNEGRPEWLRSLGRRLSTPKVRIARRLARAAGQGTVITALNVPVQHPDAAKALADCDYLVLAADTATARHIVNLLSHQYLIPMVQVGVKIPVDVDGVIGDLFTATRLVNPDGGCLRCAELIDPVKLATEALPASERRQADYGTGQPAPSVIALNAIAVSDAITNLMFAFTGLNHDTGSLHVRYHARRSARKLGTPRRSSDCSVCGSDGRMGLGDHIQIPTIRI